MMRKQKIILLFLCLFLLIGGCFFVLYIQRWRTPIKVNNQETSQRVASSSTSSPCNRFSNVDSHEQTTIQRTNYHNKKYHFRIEYPSNLDIRYFSENSQYAIDFGGTLYSGGDGLLGIIIKKTAFHTPQEWLDAEDKRVRDTMIIYHLSLDQVNERFEFEKNITISGYDAIVVHRVSSGCEALFYKTAVFIKDGKLFQITGSGTDSNYDREYERIWNSFKFE